MKTILIVTDQPFWRREDGAQQRTWSMLQCLRRNDFQLTIFFLVEMTASDDAICRESELQIVKFNPDGTRLGDRLSTVARKVLRRLGKSEPPTNDVATSSAFTPATLDTYRWPHAPRQFKSLVASLQPDFVLSVYVVWSNLLDDFPIGQRSFRAFVDTHDLLFARQQQFCEHDEAHWIAISKEEESAALQKFDLIIATQAVEAEMIRTMAPQSDVVVVGHYAELPAAPRGFDFLTVSDSATTRMGFIGSNNAANVDGIRWFLQHCWDEIHRTTGAELMIAGTVSNGLNPQRFCNQPGVQILGLIPRIEDFYAQIDFAINPVRFGSGIKIKSIESLCFGKPLVTHSHNTQGLSFAAVHSMIVADDADGFTQGCVRLIHDRDLRGEMTTRVRQVRESELSEDSVYADLLAWLRR